MIKKTLVGLVLVGGVVALTACGADPDDARYRDCIAHGGSFYSNGSNPSWECVLPGAPLVKK